MIARKSQFICQGKQPSDYHQIIRIKSQNTIFVSQKIKFLSTCHNLKGLNASFVTLTKNLFIKNE